MYIYLHTYIHVFFFFVQLITQTCLDYDQHMAVWMICEGHNVAVVGRAGTGKTRMIEHAVKKLKDNDKMEIKATYLFMSTWHKHILIYVYTNAIRYLLLHQLGWQQQF